MRQAPHTHPHQNTLATVPSLRALHRSTRCTLAIVPSLRAYNRSIVPTVPSFNRFNRFTTTTVLPFQPFYRFAQPGCLHPQLIIINAVNALAACVAFDLRNRVF